MLRLIFSIVLRKGDVPAKFVEYKMWEVYRPVVWNMLAQEWAIWWDEFSQKTQL